MTALVKGVAVAAFSAAIPAAAATVSGTVRDTSGAVVPGAVVRIVDDQRRELAATRADAGGRFQLSVPDGRYALAVDSPGFASHRRTLYVRGDTEVDVTLPIQVLSETVTVTATPGSVQSVEDSPQPVNVVSEEALRERAKSVLAQVAEGEAGVHVQRTSATIGGIFVRGLTGNKVNVFVDGVRFSTASMRGGINSFMDLIDPVALESVEILRGPSSAQYGSDAIGGSVQYLVRTPAFSPAGAQSGASWSTQFNSGDLGFGSDLTGRYARPDVSLQATLQGRRINDLRPGRGIDSHNAVTRFFGLPSDVAIGDRLPDTSFTQYGGSFKAVWAATARDELVAAYMRGQQDGGKRYDQLLGGDGNLVADLRNFMLDLGYLRYSRRQLGPFDRATLGYSYNAQREERVNQGGNGNPLASINHEYEKTRAHGAQVLLTRAAGGHALSVGGDYYRERVAAPSFAFNPATAAVTARRGRLPDGSRYGQGGVFVQDVYRTPDGRLELLGGLRWSVASYEARAADSPLISGRPLGPDDSLDVNHLTYRAGAAWRAGAGLTITASLATGFRAPHVTDLGTLGLTGSGFEVSFDAVRDRGAFVGTTADRTAVSSGLAVEDQLPERSRIIEGSLRFRREAVDTDLFVFLNDVSDNITKQTLILPAGATGTLLGDQVITSQLPTGTVFVAASTAPVLVRSNFDNARIWGVEHVLTWKLSPALRLGTAATYLHAEDRRTGAPPNIEGGTPAPEAWLKLRWSPVASRFWVEPYARLVARNTRLSTLDREDRRTGATRSRANIASFFNNGARARGLVVPGPDGIPGNADDILLATGETVSQVQTRVLGDLNSAPLLSELPGYALLGLRGGIRFGTRHDVVVDFENLTDRNYRGVSWGLDGPGRSVFVRYRVTL
jgi:outer membrane receptor protein involved in Fe transport